VADAAQRISAQLTEIATAGADAAAMAQSATRIWRSVEAALVPVVGTRGFAALLSRCILDMRREFPWLAWQRDAEQADGIALLQAALAAREPADILAVTTALLKFFCGLLTSLIGAALTERLLRTVESAPNRGHAAEERHEY
jgi:hypothetical protein